MNLVKNIKFNTKIMNIFNSEMMKANRATFTFDMISDYNSA